jgi:hypothetical protein
MRLGRLYVTEAERRLVKASEMAAPPPCDGVHAGT